jgi:hypothetical protein
MAHLRMAAGVCIAAKSWGSVGREIRIVPKVIGRAAAAASREVYQARALVLRGPTEPEGFAGQAIDRNKYTLQASRNELRLTQGTGRSTFVARVGLCCKDRR